MKTRDYSPLYRYESEHLGFLMGILISLENNLMNFGSYI